MRGTASAFEPEYDEVFVSSTAVLEANIAAVRDSLNDFKTEVRTNFANVNEELRSVRQEVKSVREDLTREIASVREDLTCEITSVREDLTGELKSLREKSDKGFERLFTKFDAEIKENSKALSELSKTVLRIDSRQGALVWVGAGLVALITLVISVGKAFNWF